MGGEGRRQFGQIVPSELADKAAYGVREPLGVVGMITPWNFPMAIPSWKSFPALVTGNTIVLKPSPETPMTAALFVKVLEEAGLPPGVMNLVMGSAPDLGEEMETHMVIFSRASKIFMTTVSICFSSTKGERINDFRATIGSP